ncbi:unnamed protein product [Ambrosiozyma monospora]|uniref:Unnamed protein product n=1 Tax=Ambrosiozyma monospora TaxID=43982 RepID=A0ACB5SVI0_AMBMO|nr:unnamed protein product [Ambrosiozyma monospora]
MYGLSDVYELEQEAERATLKNDLTTAIKFHSQSINKLDDVIQKIQKNDSSGSNRYFQTLQSLQLLKTQAQSRVDQLKLIKDRRHQQQQRLGSNGNKAQTSQQQLAMLVQAAQGKKTGSLQQQQQLKHLVSSESTSANQYTNTSNDNVNATGELQLIQALTSRISISLLKNLNVSFNPTAMAPTSTPKVQFIEHQKINDLEHQLQLLNFKEKYTKSTENMDDLKFKNDLLANLNLIYYSELLANQEFVKELLGSLKLVNQLQLTDETNDESTDSGDKITDKELRDIIQQQQLRISGLERDKIMLENQIVKLKERWNGLVENARRRKELEKQG